MPSASEIVVLCDHKYLRKKSIDILDFVLVNNHQRDAESKTTTYGWVWSVVPLAQAGCRVLDHQCLGKGSIDGIVFFAWT